MEDILQQGGQITLTALGSLAALFLLTKLSGNKQVSQMNLFDYVMGITIGSIAAEMASELESPLRPLWAMVVYGLTAWGIALLAAFMRLRRGGETLEEYLSNRVFAGLLGEELKPEPADVADFDAYLRRYVAALPVERAAVESV